MVRHGLGRGVVREVRRVGVGRRRHLPGVDVRVRGGGRGLVVVRRVREVDVVAEGGRGPVVDPPVPAGQLAHVGEPGGGVGHGDGRGGVAHDLRRERGHRRCLPDVGRLAGLGPLRGQPQHPGRRQAQRRRRRAPVPHLRLRLDDPEVAHPRAAVDLCVGVEHLAPAAREGQADPVVVARAAGEVRDAGQHGRVALGVDAMPQEAQHVAARVVGVDPGEALGRVVPGPQGRVVLVGPVEVADQST